MPHEARLLVVGIDGAGEARGDAGKLRLHAGNEGVYAVAAADRAQRSGVGAVFGLQPIDGRAPPRRIVLVPDLDILLDQVIHVLAHGFLLLRSADELIV